MNNNFNLKSFLAEGRLLKEERFYAPDYVKQKYGDSASEIENNIHDEEDNNPNIWDLYTSLETPEEVDDFVQGFINESELKEVKLITYSLDPSNGEVLDRKISNFPTIEDAEKAAVAHNYEIAYENGDTDLTKDEYLDKYSWEDLSGEISYPQSYDYEIK